MEPWFHQQENWKAVSPSGLASFKAERSFSYTYLHSNQTGWSSLWRIPCFILSFCKLKWMEQPFAQGYDVTDLWMHPLKDANSFGTQPTSSCCCLRLDLNPKCSYSWSAFSNCFSFFIHLSQTLNDSSYKCKWLQMTYLINAFERWFDLHHDFSSMLWFRAVRKSELALVI